MTKQKPRLIKRQDLGRDIQVVELDKSTGTVTQKLAREVRDFQRRSASGKLGARAEAKRILGLE